MKLTEHEKLLLSHFIVQTQEDQNAILQAAIAHPKTSGPLIVAYREVLKLL